MVFTFPELLSYDLVVTQTYVLLAFPRSTLYPRWRNLSANFRLLIEAYPLDIRHSQNFWKNSDNVSE